MSATVPAGGPPHAAPGRGGRARRAGPGARLMRAWAAFLDPWIAAALPTIMRRALRRGFAGIWSATDEPPPAGGAVVIANHHSWWDAYLAWAIADRHRRPSGAIMDAAQLARFAFFRRLGAVSDREPRAAARRAASGAWLVVYVEGSLRPPGPLGPTRPGAAAIAGWAGVPLLPVAIRCVLRGGERPEAYLRFGAALPSGTSHEAAARELGALVARLDRDVADAADPEVPVPGYEPWWPAAERGHERAARWRAWWGAT